MRRNLTITLLALLSALVLAAGCTSEEARSIAAGSSLDNSLEKSGTQASITLCRKVSRKTGRPIGESDTFVMRPRSYVNALVDFQGVETGRTHVLHLVWVRPDGKEIFRKYAEVVVEPGGEEGFLTITRWLDGVDLHDIAADTLATAEPAFRLESRLNTSDRKERDPGTYSLRVYLDRRFLLEKSFTLQDEVEPVS